MFTQQFINGIALGCLYALIALGYTLIFGIIKVIFFAQGELSMLGAFLAMGCLTCLIGHPGVPQSPFVLIPLTLLIAILVTCCVGITAERFALRPLRKAPRTKQLIASLGVSLVLQNSVFLLVSSESKPFPSLFALREIKIGNATLSNVQLFILSMALALMFGVDLLLRHSRLGLAMRTVAENQKYAALIGIDVNRTISQTFAIGSALAATAGLMMAMYDGVIKYDMGFLPGIKGFTAAILGGIGNVRGGMLGGLALGLVEAFGAGFISSDNRHLYAFVTLIVILIFRPSGILGEGRKSRE